MIFSNVSGGESKRTCTKLRSWILVFRQLPSAVEMFTNTRALVSLLLAFLAWCSFAPSPFAPSSFLTPQRSCALLCGVVQSFVPSRLPGSKAISSLFCPLVFHLQTPAPPASFNIELQHHFGKLPYCDGRTSRHADEHGRLDIDL